MRALRAQHGYTLVELLVAMVAAIAVFGATLTLFDAFQRNNRVDVLRNEIQDNARASIDRLTRELRNVTAPTTGSVGALEQAEPYSLVFQTINASTPEKGSLNATNAMRVRYCLDASTPSNEILYRQIQTWTTEKFPELKAPSTCPDSTANTWTSTTKLAQYLVNKDAKRTASEEAERQLFTFGPTGATEVSQITSVAARIYVDLTPGSQPGERQLATSIYLRNANRLPVAKFTATVVNEHVKLNASESTDPDGLALTYTWKESSKTLSSTAQQYETEKLIKGSHTFELEVTDAGGLKASAPPRTVTI